MDDEDLTLPSGSEEDATMASAGEPTAQPEGSMAGSNITFGGPTQTVPAAISATIQLTVGGTIAKGGMGAILEASDEALARNVAMKVMLPGADSSDGARQRFVREAMVLARLEHPNIVPIQQLGRDEEARPFYTMKLVKGRTLQAIISEIAAGNEETIADFPLNRLLTIFRQICDAMAFAHHRGVIHRDLKPENVMVGEFGETLVMDWGLAKILENRQDQPFDQVAEVSVEEGGMFADLMASQLTDSAELTMDGAVMGSPKYMAPEQAEGRIAEIDVRTDIYGLGGVLYTILTLRAPVTGATVKELLGKVMSGDITSPSQLTSTVAEKKGSSGRGRRKSGMKLPLPHCPGTIVPASLSVVAMTALAVDPDDRYHRVDQLAWDVEAFQTGHATSVEEVSFLGQFLLLVKRNRGISISAALGFIVVMAVTLGFLVKVEAEKNAAQLAETEALGAKDIADNERDKARQAEATAVDALAKSSLSLAEAALREGNGLLMAEALADVPQVLRNSDWRYLAAQADTSIDASLFHDRAIYQSAPDPTRPHVFACLISGGTIELRNVQNGKKLVQFQTASKKEDQTWSSLEFSPDGSKIALGFTYQSGVHIYRARDGKELLRLDCPKTHGMLFGKDSTTLFHMPVRDAREFQLAAWDARSGERLWFRGDMQAKLWASLDQSGRWLVCQSTGGAVQTLNGADGTTTSTFDLEPRSAVATSPDGSRLVYVTPDGRLLSISLPGSKTVFSLPAQTPTPNRLAYSEDGRSFVSVTELPDGRQLIRIRSADTGAVERTLLGGRGPVSSLKIHPLSREIFISGPNPRVWEDGNPAYILVNGNPVWAGSFWGAEDVFFHRIPYSNSKLMQLEPGKARRLWSPPKAAESGTADRRTGEDIRLVARVTGSRCDFYLLGRRGEQFRIVGEIETVQFPRVFRLSPDRERLAVLQNYLKGIWIQNIATGEAPQQLGGTHKWAYDIRWIAGGRELLGIIDVGAKRGAPKHRSQLVVWDSTTRQPVRSVNLDSPMDVLAIAPDGRRFAEAGANGRVRIRDVESLTIQQEFRVHDQSVTGLAWHPSRPILATASKDRSIRLWSLETTERLEELYGVEFHPRELVFSPGGARLACHDKATTRIWEPGCLNGGTTSAAGSIQEAGPRPLHKSGPSSGTDRTGK
jgi:serine/threonine protein kinase/WD40 repeat protein